MNKLILSIGLALFASTANAMDDAKEKPLSHKTQLYCITGACTYKVEFVKSQGFYKGADKVCELDPQADKVLINLSFGYARLSVMPTETDKNDSSEVMDQIVKQCKGFEDNPRMLLTPLRVGYNPFAIDFEKGELNKALQNS